MYNKNCDFQILVKHLMKLLSPLDSDLRALAQEALELIKSLVGRETLSQSYSSLRKAASQTRETRKRRQALEVSDALMM